VRGGGVQRGGNQVSGFIVAAVSAVWCVIVGVWCSRCAGA
jgi:hypothetical protein